MIAAAFATALFCVLMALFGKRSEVIQRPPHPMDDIYGSAVLFTSKGDRLDPPSMRYGADGIIMGVNHLGSPTGCLWMPTVQQGHAFAFGATRTGKFTSLIAPALMLWGGGVVVIDPKAESAWASAQRRREMGQKVIILDPWGEVQRRYADQVGVTEAVSRFNPLAHLDPDSPDFGDEISALAEALIVTSGRESQPHFPDSARELVAGLIAAVVEWKPGAGTLGDVRRLVLASDDELARHILLILQARPHSLAARKLKRFVTLTKDKNGEMVIERASNEIASIRSTASTQTTPLDTVRLLDSMDSTTDAFDMAEVASGRVSLFLVLPLEKLDTYGRWLRLIITLAVNSVARQAIPPKLPILFVLDEMGTIGKLPVVERAVGLLAGQGLRIWGFLQDLTQLQRDYPASWQTFIANAAVLQVLKCTEATTTKYFSDRLGTKTIRDVVDNESVSRSASGVSRTTSQSINYYSRPVMLPIEIENMPDDELLVLYPGGGNFRMRKATYFLGAEARRWHGLYRPNPNFSPPAARKAAPPASSRPTTPKPSGTSPEAPPEPSNARAATVMLDCPGASCGRRLRVPKDRGRGLVTCPACRTRWLFQG